MIRIGIQGGKGSFNEEAAKLLAKENRLADYAIVYLYNTKNVLKSLAAGDIDYGVFAIYNSQSLLVDETSAVMGKYLYDVVDYLTMPVRHCLMTLPQVDFDTCTKIMGHGEAVVQCATSLKQFESQCKIESGSGRYMDGAAIAEGLVNGELQEDIAVLGSRAIAEAFNLTIAKEHMEDDPQNTTTFLFVQK